MKPRAKTPDARVADAFERFLDTCRDALAYDWPALPTPCFVNEPGKPLDLGAPQIELVRQAHYRDVNRAKETRATALAAIQAVLDLKDSEIDQAVPIVEFAEAASELLRSQAAHDFSGSPFLRTIAAIGHGHLLQTPLRRARSCSKEIADATGPAVDSGKSPAVEARLLDVLAEVRPHGQKHEKQIALLTRLTRHGYNADRTTLYRDLKKLRSLDLVQPRLNVRTKKGDDLAVKAKLHQGE